MISSYKKLTGRYIKASKKRSILAVVGIVLSVALISSIGLFFKAMQEAQIEDAKNDYGSYHLAFTKASDDLISKITNNPKISRYGLFSLKDTAKIDNKLEISEVVATDKALELLPYKAKEGKLPEKENEAAVEEWVLKYIDKNAKVGSKIKFNDKEYILSGILENVIKNQIENKGMILSKSNNINKEQAVLLIEVSSKTSLTKALKELKDMVPAENIDENSVLISVESGENLEGLIAAIGIIIGIVVIATIAVIYNAFQISVIERVKQFGLLRAVGTTPKQIRNIVMREATIFAVIGIPIGLLCGIIAIYGINITFKIIGGESVIPMIVTIDPMVLLISAVVGIISIYVSALIPAFFAGRISPLVAISSRNAITKEKIKRRKNRLVQKIFGFEGSMALKNIKRNRKRYRITVFSIVISVVLFITFKSFMDLSLNVSDNINESSNMHFSVIRDYQSTEENMAIDDKIIEDLKALKTIDKVYKIYDPYYFESAMDKNKEVKEIQEMGNKYGKAFVNGVEKTLINASVVVYDDNALEASKKYLQSGNIDIEKLNRENGVILINKNRVFNEKTENSYFGPIANLKVGDEIDLQALELEEGDKNLNFGEGKVNKVKILAILENDPFNYRGASNWLKLISTEEVAKNLTGEDVKPINLNIQINDVKNEEIAEKEINSVLKSNTSLQLINNIDNNRREKTAILVIQILMYGFVVVVSLIGSVNIVNTLTTNIILRKREFAALKSIGLTQKGLKKMIVLEGLLYGIMGTIYGSIISCGLSYLMYRGINDVREQGFMLPWKAIAIAGTCAIIIGYLSVLSPLKRIKKENLIEAIREEF